MRQANTPECGLTSPPCVPPILPVLREPPSAFIGMTILNPVGGGVKWLHA